MKWIKQIQKYWVYYGSCGTETPTQNIIKVNRKGKTEIKENLFWFLRQNNDVFSRFKKGMKFMVITYGDKFNNYKYKFEFYQFKTEKEANKFIKKLQLMVSL